MEQKGMQAKRRRENELYQSLVRQMLRIETEMKLLENKKDLLALFKTEDPQILSVNKIYKNGWEQGYSRGITRGMDIGFFKGSTETKDLGFQSGFADGIMDGHQHGFEVGYKAAIRRCLNIATANNIELFSIGISEDLVGDRVSLKQKNCIYILYIYIYINI